MKILDKILENYNSLTTFLLNLELTLALLHQLIRPSKDIVS